VHAAPFWLVAIVIGRDLAFALVWGLIKLLGLGLPTTTLFVGKISTGVQVITVLTLLLLLALDRDAPRLTLALALACAFFTLLAAAGYAAAMVRGFLAGRRVPQ
jgi:phosphatidylglycerophosphate synthase